MYGLFCSITFFLISQEASLFPFSKIVEVYLQNIARGAFLFRIRIGIVHRGERIFLITSIGDRTSQSNCNSFSLAVNATCGFALS